MLPSGIAPVDQHWEGLQAGGVYLVSGRAQSGRELLALQVVRAGCELEESALFISPRRPKDLVALAQSVGFDLPAQYERGRVKLLRIPPSLSGSGLGDGGIESALVDLVALAERYRPSRLVIEDFTPFLRFRQPDRFARAFERLLRGLAPTGATLVLGVAEPASEEARYIFGLMQERVTGTLLLQLTPRGEASSARDLTLRGSSPHPTGDIRTSWDLDEIVRTEPASYSTSSHSLPPQGATLKPAADPFGEHDAYSRGDGYDLQRESQQPARETPPAPAFQLNGLTASHDGFGAPASASDTPEEDPFGTSVEELALDGSAPAPFEAPGGAMPAAAAPDPPAPASMEPDDNPFIDLDWDAVGAPPAAERPEPAAPVATAAPTPDADPDEDPFALAAREGAATEAGPSEAGALAATAPGADVLTAPGSREAFEDAVVYHFLARAAGQHFTLVALRAAAPGPDFDAVVSALAEVLPAGASLHRDGRSAAVLLPGAGEAEATGLFRRLRAHLAAQHPGRADALIASASAIVAVDGRPFGSAEVFMRLAFPG